MDRSGRKRRAIGELGNVGGNSDNVSNGNAGPSYLNANNSLDNSNSNNGARLAFKPGIIRSC